MQIDLQDIRAVHDSPRAARREAHEPLELPRAVDRPRAGLRAIPLALITLFLLAAHGWCLTDGLFFDDHLHITRYASPDWSWQGLLDASTVKPDEFIHAWWQERVIEWHYTRPVSILLGKIVYQLSGHSPMALHALSLTLHWGSSIMVYWLALQLTRRQGWSTVAGLLFVVYSHSVYAVAWLAAQNCVLQTFLTLAALIAYIKGSGLDLYAVPDTHRSTLAAPSASRTTRNLWFAGTLVLWVLAMLSREAAIVLPLVLASLDLAFGGRRHLRSRWPAYVAMAAIGVAFVAWRLTLAYHPIPDFYIRRYDGPVYIGWYLVKLLHWVTAAIWLSPMTLGPTARIDPLREVPLDCLLMLAITLVMGLAYFAAARRARGWWIWPLWILVIFLPVVPVMAGPHSGYTAGVGFSIAMILGPALRDRLFPSGKGKWTRPVASWFLIATCIYIPIYRGMWGSMNATERFTMAGVAADPPPPGVRHVFFLNLPFVNVYAKLHLKETLGPQGEYDVHALTFAPNLLKVEHPTHLEQLDDRTFRVRLDGGRSYFSGALGRYLIEAMRPTGRLKQGEVVKGELFDVEATQADADGARELTFRFQAPLTSPEYAFYLTTNQCGAARVRFTGDAASLAAASTPAAVEIPIGRGDVAAGLRTGRAEIENAAAALEVGNASAAATLFTAAASDDTTLRGSARTALQRHVEPVLAALGAPLQGLSYRPEVSASDWAQVRSWWSLHVDDAQVRALLGNRERFAAFCEAREQLFRTRERASWIIRTDLYMTGPPFPSPK